MPLIPRRPCQAAHTLNLHRAPYQPVRIAAIRLALDNGGFAAEGQLIPGSWLATSLARTSKVAVSEWVRTATDNP
jgi:hypothetical protein